jgi:signal transduction histidine kinase
LVEQGDVAGMPGGQSQRAAIIGFVTVSAIVSFLIDFQRRTLIRARIAERAQAAIASENARLLKEAQQAHTELSRSNEDLMRSNRDLEIFAYSASHDLKEPLRTIAIYPELMQRNAVEVKRNGGAWKTPIFSVIFWRPRGG